ncbi:hypothetical protein KP509_18G063600 [Ceratopteris richardii]|uniref:Uncharacterized protein n=1 Tax=Ceratopteris richardii TaxID=49495 RepID=A0A8T2SSE2_CERRI|nr:hypothetical protein KP509_18G063600 [Ceratopteris richardii]
MVKKVRWVIEFGYLSSRKLYAAGMLLLMRGGCFKTIVPQERTIKGSDFSMTSHLLGPILTLRMQHKGLKILMIQWFFEPEDNGQQDEAPEGHMQLDNDDENCAGSNGQQPNNDDLVIPPDVNPLPDNVDHWVRRSTRPRRNVSRFDPSSHYIMLTDEGEPLTYKEAKTCEHRSKWELAMQEEVKENTSSNQ